MPVRPQRFASAIAACSADLRCSRDIGGITRAMSSCALSTKTPAGTPPAPRSMRPPSGSCVAAVTPAAVLANAMAITAAGDPRSRGRGLRARDDAGDHLVVALRADEVHTRERHAEPQHVRVRIGDAGDDGATTVVNDPAVRAAERHRTAERADEHDLPAADRHRFGDGPRAVSYTHLTL